MNQAPAEQLRSVERVMRAVRHEPVDRVPLSYWSGWNPPNRDALIEKYGDMDAALDALNIDTRTAQPPGIMFSAEKKRCASVKEALEFQLEDDPLDPDRYELPRAEFEARRRGGDPKSYGFSYGLKEAVEKFKGKRAVFCHVWGVTEMALAFFGIEDMLLQSAADPKGLKELLMRLGEFGAKSAEKALEYGPDVIQISDDWGMNERLMFRPEFWWDAIHPATKLITDAIRGHNVPIILHSDGYILDVIDGIIDLGFDMIHPIQASAGIDQAAVKKQFGEKLGIYGGLDVTHTLPFGTLEEIDSEIQHVMKVLGEGSGYIFAPAHRVPPEVSLERIEYFYERAMEHSC